MTREELTLSEAKKILARCISSLRKNDSVLLTNDVSERAVAHKFAEYLQQEFRTVNVDC
jgi:hypothetical protein